MMKDKVTIEEFDRIIFLILIDYIEVKDPIRADVAKQYKIAIHYKFVGNLEQIHSAA